MKPDHGVTLPAAAAENVLLNQKQAAQFLGLTTSCLEKWRWQRKGPPYTKPGGKCVRYSLKQLQEWIAAQGTHNGGLAA